MSNTSKKYIVEGVSFDSLGLYSFSLSKLSVFGTPQWEREIWSFIVNWLDQSEAIQVNTSGSTSEPKTISLLKKNMQASAEMTLSFFKLERGDTCLLCLPMKYIAGKMMVVRALVGGLNLLFVEPSSKPDLTPFKKIDFSAMVPMQLKNFTEDENSISELEKIDKLIIGGGFLPVGLSEATHHAKTKIWQTYGMTETITHIALRKVNGKHASDWYKTLPGVKVEMDSRGCLQIDAAKIGVHQLSTNDLVEMHEDGQFKLTGRADNIINTGGVKLSPEVIESKIEKITDRVFYIGSVPDEVLGERLVLFIEGEHLTLEETTHLWKEINKKLSGYEVPKEIICQREFNRTVSGKINRQKKFL